MNDTQNTLDLSDAAIARRSAMLPGLLTAVKKRRHRRHAVRGVAAVALVTVVIVLVQGLFGLPANPATPSDRGPDRIAVASWTTFGNDPTVLERCVITTVSRPEWFVSDDEVNSLLRDSGRPSGIIRAGGRTLVNQNAFDPWPEATETEE